MPYMIPQNIKYEERLIGPLTMKQSLYAGAGCAIIMYVLIFSTLPFVIKAILTVVIGLLTIGFSMFDLEKYIINYVKFTRQPKRTSWISPAAKELLNIRAIRADSVFLRGGRVLGLVKVTPINFGVLSDSDRDSVIYGFLEFLNSLNFPIQIVMRSVNLDLDDYLRALKRMFSQQSLLMLLPVLAYCLI